MTVGTLELVFVIRGCRSLKEKRHVIKPIKERIRSKFNVSVAEIDAQDMHQKAVLAVAAIGSERRFVESVLTQVGNLARSHPHAELTDSHMELL
jgi:uncharacterized protein YlxP (DUF503 family)